MCLPPYMFAKIAKGGRVPYIGLCRYTYLVPWACHHMFVYIYINHLCSFCLPPYVRKRSLIKRTRRKVSCGKAPTSRDNLGHLSEAFIYVLYYNTTIYNGNCFCVVCIKHHTNKCKQNTDKDAPTSRDNSNHLSERLGFVLYYLYSGTVVVCSDYMKKKKCLLCFCHKYIKYKRRSHLVSM